MKRVWIYEGEYADRLEPFSNPCKAYDFLVKSNREDLKIHSYSTYLKKLREEGAYLIEDHRIIVKTIK